MRFQLRTLIAVVSVCAVIALLYSNYRDYIDLPLPTYSSLSSAEIDVAVRNRVKMIKQNHPPKTKEYWEEQLNSVKPKMTMNALFKYVPSVGDSYSLLRSDGNQTFYYAVDSKYGVACTMSTSADRVVKPLGVFEHSMYLDEFGGIEIENISGIDDFLAK